jgi:hypothetical protein
MNLLPSLNFKLLIPPEKRFRYLLILIFMVIALWWIFFRMPALIANDFIEYWSAARINVTGGNPYDPNQLLLLQNSSSGLAWDRPLIIYNPPWTLTFLLPFGLFRYSQSQILWLFLNITIIFFCSNSLWTLYGGSSRIRWISWIIGFTFAPSFTAIGLRGQISPVLLLGIVGFIVFIEKPGSEWLAGMFAALATFKPQITFLFFVSLFIWSIYKHRFKAIITLCGTLVSLTLVTVLINPHVLSQYAHTIISHAPMEWATPTIGAYLRILLGTDNFWLQFIPPVIGLLWLASYCWRNRYTWSWKETVPFILLISLLTSAYAWSYDWILLLFIVIQAAIWLMINWYHWKIAIYIISYIAFNLFYFYYRLRVEDIWLAWFLPIIFIWYLFLTRSFKPKPLYQVI